MLYTDLNLQNKINKDVCVYRDVCFL